MNKIALELAATAALWMTTPAEAAVTLVLNGPQLLGATGVSIGGSLYDVSFVDGTCTGLFGGCTSSSDFTFQTLADATAASQALLDQVLLNGPIPFDGAYYLTLGCSQNSVSVCAILTPYGVGTDIRIIGPAVSAAVAVNTPSTIDFTDAVVASVSAFDSGNFPQWTWARYTLEGTGIPEPSTWAMMLLGFGAIGAAMRRRRVAALA